ncbi:MAG TPA: polyprenyl synthetase family protein [Candidatus Saccharimonadia bacterium]|jgi:geranylgeranyl pyrophosphate synthase|nr:polyprenyl synthetase family protein [Candidatus Saccharimonadia bacterium]
MSAEGVDHFLHIPGQQALIRSVDHRLATMLPETGGALQRSAAAAVRRGGKRLRPLLVLAAADGQNLETALQAASAVELLHLGTLVHDDIIDHAAVRWGAPTVSQAEGLARAVLVGDYLITKAQAAAGPDVAQVLAETLAVMCEGQDEEAAVAYDPDRSVASYLDSSRKKTAALIAAACRIGGLCAALPAGQQTALEAFGVAFGTAFQLIDDLLDLLSSEEVLGKPAGHDIGQGVYTLAVLYGLQGPDRETVRGWLSHDPQHHPAPAEAARVLRRDGSVDRVFDEITRYNERAVAALSPLGHSAAAGALRSLPDTYLTWAMKRLVY